MKTIVKVDKIRSYQTLVYKNGSRSYTKKEYREYAKQIMPQISHLEPYSKEKRLRLNLDFNFSKGKRIDIDNCVKAIQDIIQLSGKFVDDAQIFELNATKSFGNTEEHMVIELIEIT